MSRCRRPRSARSEAERKAWLAKAAEWDGTAHVYDPMARRLVLAEWYRGQIAEPTMWHFDRLSPKQRRNVANSVDGYF